MGSLEGAQGESMGPENSGVEQSSRSASPSKLCKPLWAAGGRSGPCSSRQPGEGPSSTSGASWGGINRELSRTSQYTWGESNGELRASQQGQEQSSQPKALEGASEAKWGYEGTVHEPSYEGDGKQMDSWEEHTSFTNTGKGKGEASHMEGWEERAGALTSGIGAGGDAGPAGTSTTDVLLQRLLDSQQQHSEYKRRRAEEHRRAQAEQRAAADKAAALARRRQRQESRRGWTTGAAKVLCFISALLAAAMLIALLLPPETTWVNSAAWRGNGRWAYQKNACWSPGVVVCQRWQKAYGIGASVAFALEMSALLLAVGVVVGWSSRLHVALLLFLAGSWCAALSVASMFWLSSTYWLAVFVSVAMAVFVAASVLVLPAVVLLPLIWLYSRIPCLGGRARARLRLGGIDCERTALVHWAAAAHAGARNAASRLVLGMLLRLLAASDDAALDPPGAVSPLFIAADAGDLAAVRVLLAAGADPDHTFWSYVLEGPYHGLNFPLKAAAAGGHRETVRELLRADADPNALDDKGRSALHEAAARGHSSVLDVLLGFGATANAADAEGRAPLHLACTGGHARAVELLLRSGVGIDAADRHGCTPLQAAAVGGHAQIVERLLSRGANIHTSDVQGYTPLHAAAVGRDAGAVEALLAAGLNPNIPDVSGYTALHAAVVGGNLAVVEALLAGGADPNLADAHGYTPLHAAIVGGHSQVVAALLAAGADPTLADLDCNSPLHVAAAAGNLEMVRAFRASGLVLDATTPNAGGASARQVAELSGWRHVASEFEDWERQQGAATEPQGPTRWGQARALPQGFPQQQAPGTPLPTPRLLPAGPGGQAGRALSSDGGGLPARPDAGLGSDGSVETPKSGAAAGAGGALGTEGGPSPEAVVLVGEASLGEGDMHVEASVASFMTARSGTPATWRSDASFTSSSGHNMV